LLERLSPYDRRHALAVYDLLLISGCEDQDVLLAALFHDAGKADERGRVHVAHRVALVLGRSVAPGAIERMTLNPSRNRFVHGLYLASEHARLGADAARTAGLPERACALVEQHDTRLPPDDPALALLIWADGRAL
jgi:HD superfamily phosphodiesterase